MTTQQIQRFEGGNMNPEQTTHPRILVPLDGSTSAEKALRLAESICNERDGEIWLVRVLPELPPQHPGWPGPVGESQYDTPTDVESAQAYLAAVARRVSTRVFTRVLAGPTIEALAEAVRAHAITAVVMTSNGHSGPGRSGLGSLASGLLSAVSVPVFVVPTLARTDSLAEHASPVSPPVSVG